MAACPFQQSLAKRRADLRRSAPAQQGRRGMIQELLPQAERIGAILKARGETISIAESSTAGLISAALLAVGGASAYFMGGAVVYTRASRTELLRVTDEEFAALKGITPSTEPYALLFARTITVETGKADRVDNMRAFSVAALDLLEKCLG